MPTRLKEDALEHLKKNENAELLLKVCAYAGINQLYAVQAINRGSKALTTWKAVELIAKSLNKKPEHILEER